VTIQRKTLAWLVLLGTCSIGMAPPTADTTAQQDQPEAEVSPPLSDELARARLVEAVQQLRDLLEPGAEPSEADVAALDARLADLATRTTHPDLTSAARLNLGLLRQATGLGENVPDTYREADRTSTRRELRAEARFNLAHVLYEEAIAPPPPAESLDEEPAPTNPIDELKTRIAKLRPAAAAFRSVLEVDPTRTDAAENCEKIKRQIARAQQELEQLEDLMEQMRQQGENLDRLADEQQDASDESEQSDQSRREELEQQQQDLSKQTEQAQQQLDQTRQQASQSGQEQVRQQVEQSQQDVQQARAAQDEAEQALREGDLDRASERQQEAADALRRAAENLQQSGEQQEGEQGEEQQDQPNPDEHNQQTGQQQQPQQDPGDQLVEDLLDREQRQREERELRRSRLARPVTVERDW